MRLQLSFLLLLALSATATSVIFRELISARGGDGLARALVLGLAPIDFIAIVLLSRIVVKVHQARERGGPR